jgi:translation initiation factor IF-2
VLDGAIIRSAEVRLLRDNVVVYTGKVASLRRFKDDVSEVKVGMECGISLENFADIKQGDIIEAFANERVATEVFV